MNRIPKKIFAILMCGLIMMSNVLPIKASSEECPECEFATNENYIKPGYEMTSNESMSTYATFRNLNIDERFQTTTENRSINLLNCNSNYTIYSHGCALTAFTMVVNYLKGTSYYPKSVNTVLKSAFTSNGRTGCLMYWPDAADAYDLDHLFTETDENGFSQSYYNNVLKTQLDNRVPIIVGLKYTNGNKHFVLVKGYELNGSTYTFYINDPNHYNENNGLVTLNDFISNGAIIRQLTAFDY